MIEFNRKNKNNFWHSPLVILALFGVLILFIYNMIGLFEKERETNKKKELILSQIEILRVREKSLNSDIVKLKTEEGVEETIRDKFQVVKEGEKMVVIVDEEIKKEEPFLIKNSHGFWGWLKDSFRFNK